MDKDEGSLPTMPATAQADPEEPIPVPEPYPPGLPLEHHQLMPERDVLKREIASTLQRGNDTPPHDTYPNQLGGGTARYRANHEEWSSSATS